MSFDPKIHNRRSIRLSCFDYSKSGVYFVTICTEDRLPFFGQINDGEVLLNAAGEMVLSLWHALKELSGVTPDEFVVMPNHIHGILWLEESPSSEVSAPIISPRPQGTLAGTLGRIMQRFKSLTTNQYIAGVKIQGWCPFPGRLWQRNYFEHIVRDDEALKSIRDYIRLNPQRWESDVDNPQALKKESVEAFLEAMGLQLGKGRSQRSIGHNEGEHEVRPYRYRTHL